MQLVMVGVADMRAFIHINDGPFLRGRLDDALFLRRTEADVAPGGAFKPDLPLALLRPIAEALATRPDELDYLIPKVPFSTWPLMGRGLEFRLDPQAILVRRLRDDAIRLLALDYPNLNDSIEVQRDPNVAQTVTISFSKSRLQTIIQDAEISLRLRMYSVGFTIIRLTIGSSAPDFGTYWYPASNILEAATYHATSIAEIFDGRLPVDALEGLGSINTALANFRGAVCDYFRPEVVREVSRRQLDEIDSGFEPILRACHDEAWSDGLAIAHAINGSGGLTSIKTTKRDAYLGWAAMVFVERDASNERAIFNAELCVFIYNLFFFYERFLSEYLSMHVFSSEPISRGANVEGHRRFGDAIFYLADLLRGSNSGADRVFYEVWARVSKLDDLRKKTSAGLDAVVARLDERNKRRTELWAGRFALITAFIGLTSLLEFLNGLREYLEEPKSGHTITTLSHLKYLSPPGYDVFGAYALVLLFILAAWFYTRSSERR